MVVWCFLDFGLGLGFGFGFGVQVGAEVLGGVREPAEARLRLEWRRCRWQSLSLTVHDRLLPRLGKSRERVWPNRV